MSEKVKQAAFYCEKNGQEHLKEYLNPPYAEKAQKLAKQIINIDFKLINGLYKNISNAKPKFEMEFDITPQDVFDLAKANSRDEKEMYLLGINSLADGEVAAITLAGGQGTRLGHNGPKGTFILDVIPPMSLFEIQSRRLIEISKICGHEIPWLIMTSEENHDATLDFFEKNNYFGYNSKILRFFPQGMLPIVDFNGKILVDNDNIASGPDGNGGIFSQLKKSGNLEWLKGMDIKKVFICGIDNPLVKMADPVFIGFSKKTKSDIVCKSALKSSWNENAGVFCKKDKKPFYIEYTDIPENKAKATDDEGNYLFGDIGIVMYVYNIELLDRISEHELPYHEARKKLANTLPTGERITPEKPNCIKYETFIFDSFDYANSVSVMRISRDEEFAPIKNKSGNDSSEIASKLYMKINR